MGFRKLGEPLFSLGLGQRFGMGGRKTVGGDSYEIPSYSNSGGQGDRTAQITATTDIPLLAGIFATSPIDGITASGGWYFDAVPVAGLEMRFDFHRKVIINEITWYKDGFAGAQGIFQPQLSNDGVTWTNCGTTIDFFGSSAPFVITALSANTIPARYYRLLGVSGNSVITVQYEIEFKIGNPL